MTTTRPGTRYSLGFRIVCSKGPVLTSRFGRRWGSIEEAASAARAELAYLEPHVMSNCVVDVSTDTVAWVPPPCAEWIKVGDRVSYVGERVPAGSDA